MTWISGKNERGGRSTCEENPAIVCYKRMPSNKNRYPKGDKWALLVDEEQITSNINKTIYNQIWNANGKEYWVKKLGIHPIYAHLIDWEVVRKASKMCKDQKRKRRIKHMANIGPIGKVLFQ